MKVALLFLGLLASLWMSKQPPIVALVRPTMVKRTWRFIKFSLACVLGLITLQQGIEEYVGGSLLPTTPVIALPPTVQGSDASTLFLKVSNQSWLFPIRRADLACIVDLVLARDAESHIVFIRNASFYQRASEINRNLNFRCDANFLTIQSDGTLFIGYEHGSHVRVMKAGLRPPLSIIKLCTAVIGSYQALGRAHPFKSEMFQWPAAPGLNQWISGPIAFDFDQSGWLAPPDKLAAAFSFYSLSERMSDGSIRIRSDALACSPTDKLPRTMVFRADLLAAPDILLPF